uniref:F-box/kelch-repeat protein At5g15710 isoform X1 n=2 Tax=Elaeis guineensis var. tenera TaxID=51953 RepID=A0A6J0PEV2_ELAGV|nr:F-box/kelch-repeat protein At5g15710 isoform X1 [Elaeis guineensis]
MESVDYPYVLALIDEFPSAHYKIVAVSSSDPIYSQVFDSRSGRWELKGQFPGKFSYLGNAVFLDGLLFVLSHEPDHLLTFDPIGGDWNLVDVAMPRVVCSHILDYEDRLFLVGGVEVLECIAGVGIWELDLPKKEWRSICFMPDEFFRVFRHGRLTQFRFSTVARRGIVCFFNNLYTTVLMFDLPARRWWWPLMLPHAWGRRFWFGHAIEPRIDPLKGSDGRRTEDKVPLSVLYMFKRVSISISDLCASNNQQLHYLCVINRGILLIKACQTHLCFIA